MSLGLISFKRDCCEIPPSESLPKPSKLSLFTGIPSITINGCVCPIIELAPLI